MGCMQTYDNTSGNKSRCRICDRADGYFWTPAFTAISSTRLCRLAVGVSRESPWKRPRAVVERAGDGLEDMLRRRRRVSQARTIVRKECCATHDGRAARAQMWQGHQLAHRRFFFMTNLVARTRERANVHYPGHLFHHFRRPRGLLQHKVAPAEQRNHICKMLPPLS